MVRPEIQAILRPATSTEYTKLQYFQALVGWNVCHIHCIMKTGEQLWNYKGLTVLHRP
jgi:hypothetical protein